MAGHVWAIRRRAQKFAPLHTVSTLFTWRADGRSKTARGRVASELSKPICQ
jgi:hypothetical protein